MTRRGYNVVNTFCDGWVWDYRMGCPPAFLIPNVPMAARKTLLAQMLKKGSYAFGGQWKDRFAPLVMPRRPARKDIYRDCFLNKSLFGKLIGVEIEYYPTKPWREMERKGLTAYGSDGSLREDGRELRKLTWSGPSGRLYGVLRLNLAGKVDMRCGLHVHIDARHLGQNGLLSAPETYTKLTHFYPFLKKLVPKSRWNNRYCEWKNNCPDSYEYLTSERYCAINYSAFSKFGSIEFRCQGGSTNAVKIETWALLCQFLLNWCAKPENKEPKTWKGFLEILPEPFRSWCILRKQKLHDQPIILDPRALSAMDITDGKTGKGQDLTINTECNTLELVEVV